MVVERFELPITFFAKWSYLWELMSDVQKHVIRFKPDTLEWAVDFGLLRVRRLARELRLEKKVVSAGRRRHPIWFRRVCSDGPSLAGTRPPLRCTRC